MSDVRSTLSIPLNDSRLAEILIDALSEFRAGERIDIEDLKQLHPEFSEQIEGMVPALEMLGQLERETTAFAMDSGSSDESLPTIGDFRIIRQIGQGGMGVVYEAEQLSLGRRVALKVLPFAQVFDEHRLQRFRNEAFAAANLDHPNIVPVYDCGVDRGVQYLAMKFIEGRNLAQELHLEQNPSTLEDTATAKANSTDAEASSGRSSVAASNYLGVTRRAIDVARALDYAHQCGVIHRDVKPSNLLIDEKGQIWVADFGLAQIDGGPEMTATGQVVGTLRYMSPEQAQGRTTTAATDIYSLGATLYEWISLEPAFPETDRVALARDVITREPKRLRSINPEIPAELDVIVQKAMDKDPARRYPSAAEFADDLLRFTESRPILARPPSMREQISKWIQRHQAIFNTVATASLAIIVILIGSIIWISKENWETREALQAKGEALGAAASSAATATQNYQKAVANSKRAEAHAVETDAVIDYLVNTLFTAFDPRDFDNGPLTIHGYLRHASKNLGELGASANHEAGVLRAMAICNIRLGEFYIADRHATKSWKLYCQTLGETNNKTLDSLRIMAVAKQRQGKQKEATQLVDEALESALENDPKDDVLIFELKLLKALNAFHHKKYEVGVELLTELRRIRKLPNWNNGLRSARAKKREQKTIGRLVFGLVKLKRFDEAAQLLEAETTFFEEQKLYETAFWTRYQYANLLGLQNEWAKVSVQLNEMQDAMRELGYKQDRTIVRARLMDSEAMARQGKITESEVNLKNTMSSVMKQYGGNGEVLSEVLKVYELLNNQFYKKAQRRKLIENWRIQHVEVQTHQFEAAEAQGHDHLKRENFDSALLFFRQALQALDPIQQPAYETLLSDDLKTGFIGVLCNVGMCYRRSKEYREAIVRFQACLNAKKGIDASDMSPRHQRLLNEFEFNAIENSAIAHIQLDEFKEAERLIMAYKIEKRSPLLQVRTARMFAYLASVARGEKRVEFYQSVAPIAKELYNSIPASVRATPEIQAELQTRSARALRRMLNADQ